MSKIAVVTDSTADLPLSFYKENDVTMVPLVVRFGEEAYKDWVEISPSAFYGKLKTVDKLPTTSQPSVQEFIEAYEKHSDCEHIISVHLSAKLSGTYQSAYIAAQNVNTPVTVIDSKLATVGLGTIVIELVKARNEGKPFEELLAIAHRITDATTTLFYVDTLRYLEMGGRIGKASALLGSILNIKPILMLDDGIVAPFKKVKGRKKVVAEIINELTEKAIPGKLLKICLVHADASDALAELEAAIQSAGIAHEIVAKSEVGSIIGTYTGPGTFAIIFYSE